MAKPKKIDISEALKLSKVEQVINKNVAAPAVTSETRLTESSLPSQSSNSPQAMINKVQGNTPENLVQAVKSSNQNVIGDKVDVAESQVQKLKSIAKQPKVPKNLQKPPTATAGAGTEKTESAAKRSIITFKKLTDPKILITVGALLLMALSGVAGYVVGVSSSSSANHSEALALPPISFESVSKGTTTPPTSETSPLDLSSLPPYEFYDWPLQEAGRVSSCFGSREILGVNNFHKGLDIAVSEGTPVTASRTGVVERFRVRADAMGYGTFVLLLHADGMRTLYAHLQPQLTLQLGQKIAQGEVFAHSGNTGHSTGPHLHFEVISPEAQAINPAQFLENRLEAPLYSNLDESCWYRDLTAFQR